MLRIVLYKLVLTRKRKTSEPLELIFTSTALRLLQVLESLAVFIVCWIILLVGQHYIWKLPNPVSEAVAIQAKSVPGKITLRLDWTNVSPQSDLAKRMMAHQQNCSLPQGKFVFRNRFGMGSDMHLWGNSLCHGILKGLRIRTLGSWVWMDQEKCNEVLSPLLCYFEETELNCPGDVDSSPIKEEDNFAWLSRTSGVVDDSCQPI